MKLNQLHSYFVICLLALVFRVDMSFAFDPQTAFTGKSARVDAFKFGARAYKDGNPEKALLALEFASDRGHPIARWKLARMYSIGDGVSPDQARAFRLYSSIVEEYANVRPGTPNARFVASAFVAIGEYFVEGIPRFLRANPAQGREVVQHAATFFRDAQAQFRLGVMYRDGTGGDQNSRQAARWLKRSAQKGHKQAPYTLGDMLFYGKGLNPQPVNGLKWLTVARMLNPESETIRIAQDDAFSIASKEERRIAVRLSNDWIMEWKNAY
ncbi:MAG: sel1 repeat family protein [Cohaesibacteraceae bacterium]|nr:sel1 repeat family protein [Cohaesibacteraceae bacterium]